MYDYLINVSQSGQIASLNERCDELQKQVEEQKNQIEMLSKWIEYLKEIHNGIINSDSVR